MVSADLVRWFLQVVMSEPAGVVLKEVETIFQRCHVTYHEPCLRLLAIAFQPLCDPDQAEAGRMCITRPCVKQAVYERYLAQGPAVVSPTMLHRGSLESSANNSPIAMLRSPIVPAADRRAGPGRAGASDGPDGPGPEASGGGGDSEDDDHWLSDACFSDADEDSKPDSRRRAGQAAAGGGTAAAHECWFGSVVLVCDRPLFDRFCTSSTLASTGEFHRRFNTMDFNELLLLLRFTDIFPSYVSKGEVIKAFKKANQSAHKQWVYDITASESLRDSDADVHEMGYEEFVDCMHELVRLYGSRNSTLSKAQETAATVIQRKLRGLKHRRPAAPHKDYDALASRQKLREEQVSQMMAAQALAQAKREGTAMEQSAALKEAYQQHAKQAREMDVGGPPPAIRGRVRRAGDLQAIQDKFKAVFNAVQDAFVWFDNDGNERITNVELERGLERLGLKAINMKKICLIVAADGVVDVLEFLRTFSWHDVRDVNQAVHEAKRNRRWLHTRMFSYSNTLTLTCSTGP